MRKVMRSYFWTDFDERLMAKFAENGRSQSYVAKELERSPQAIAIKASQLGIRFHGRPGAPLGNKNAAGRHRLTHTSTQYLGGFANV